MFSFTFWQLHCKAEQQQHTRTNRAWDCWLSSQLSALWTWVCCIHSEFFPWAEKTKHGGLVGLCFLYEAEVWLMQNVSCAVSLLTVGRDRLQGSSGCLHKLKTSPQNLSKAAAWASWYMVMFVVIVCVDWKLAWGFKLHYVSCRFLWAKYSRCHQDQTLMRCWKQPR